MSTTFRPELRGFRAGDGFDNFAGDESADNDVPAADFRFFTDTGVEGVDSSG